MDPLGKENKEKRERVHNENTMMDKEKGKKYDPRATGYYNIIIYYNIHDCRCNENSRFDKVFKICEFFF